MWVFTKRGFFTAVEDMDDANLLIIRCRVRADINNIRKAYFPEMSRTTFHEDFDYPYRARITKDDFARGMERLTKDIDYGRFKPAVEAMQGKKRANLYTSIWSRLIDLEVDPHRIKKYFQKSYSD